MCEGLGGGVECTALPVGCSAGIVNGTAPAAGPTPAFVSPRTVREYLIFAVKSVTCNM